jgi:tryptophan-rich sensory protein
MEKTSVHEVLRLTISIVICQLAGLIGSFFTSPAIQSWYAALRKPAFTPPNWLFAPVWTTLFLLMGVSLFLVWRKPVSMPKVRTALVIFAVQLALNVLWSILFFGLRSPLAGFIEILILWAVILLTIVNFYRLSSTAGMLLIPYILWVSFAAFLNFSLWRLNT